MNSPNSGRHEGGNTRLLQGENTSVAAAIEDHWKPNGPSDRLPEDKVGLTVALADKLTHLSASGRSTRKPTGSKDPYALRRAALGVVRMILEKGIRLRWRPLPRMPTSSPSSTTASRSICAIKAPATTSSMPC